MQREALKMGIPLRTRHREVAPNQYEMAPLFGTVTTQIDQNVWAMQIIEEMAAAHGLAALMQEKPFNDVNGSGKHNNWSIGTACGTNLLNVGQLAKNSGSSAIFPVIIAAIVSAVDKHGDLLRAAIASPGNDFRLGACEAPPAILSTYLGDDLTKYLEVYKKDPKAAYVPASKVLNLGAAVLPTLEVPAEDRNRTSPFPYGGHRFEFRAVGSSQNVSMVNTVLQTICADAFKLFADKIEAGATPHSVAVEALNTHAKVIFNGNNYCPDSQAMLTKRGVWRIDSGVDAIQRLTHAKNVKLFADNKVRVARAWRGSRSVCALLPVYPAAFQLNSARPRCRAARPEAHLFSRDPIPSHIPTPSQIPDPNPNNSNPPLSVLLSAGALGG